MTGVSDGDPVAEGDEPQRSDASSTDVPSKYKALRSDVDQWVEDLNTRLQAARPRYRVVDSCFVALDHDTRSGGSVLAGAVAFRLFLFFVPFVFVLVYGFGLAADASDRDPSDLARDAGVAGLIASTIETSADQSILTRLVTLGIALYTLLVTSRTLLKVLAASHALVWRVAIQKMKKLTKPALVAIGFVLLQLLLVQGIQFLRDQSLIAGLVALVLYMGVPAALWVLVSARVLPHVPGTSWHDFLWGGVVVGVGLEILHLVTIFWIARTLANKSETYGAIGSALALLLWAYLLGRLLVGSASINASLFYRRHPEATPAVGVLTVLAAPDDQAREGDGAASGGGAAEAEVDPSAAPAPPASRPAPPAAPTAASENPVP
jgi:uncharacterized BrkB/YihY/UPF0761 family membrane protein